VLTKELLRFSFRGGQIMPRLIDRNDRSLRNLAQELLTLYEMSVGQTVEELADMTTPVVNSYRSPLIARGLNKLALDRCEFAAPDPELETRRMTAIRAAAELLRSPHASDLTAYRQQLAAQLDTDSDTLSSTLYADLPIRQPLQSFSSCTPESLLDRYNLAQAQGLLFWASAMDVRFTEPDAGRKRQLFRQLRFFRLLTSVQQESEHTFALHIDGPISLLQQTQKYGLQLASFLPALCPLRTWWMEARIAMRDQPPATLRIDQSLGLRSHYSQTTEYRPEGIRLFIDLFAQQHAQAPDGDGMAPDQAGWSLSDDIPLLPFPGGEIVVPDLSFRHTSGQHVHLELFHRWHAAPLIRRLQAMDQGDMAPLALAIGVDRALAKDPGITPVLRDSSWYQAHGFEFNDIPPVRRVVACLDGFVE
jgi:predicted nuclease of restriction endonuclease-like RecB superfamily